PFIQSQFYTALTIPAFLFGVIAGPVVDMANKRKTMLITNGILILLFFLYIFTNEQVIFIMILAFSTASVARFFIPAEAAEIPRIVTQEELEQANAIFLFTLLGSVLAGYSLAGPLIQLFGGLGTVGERMPFLIATVALIIGFVLCFFISQKEKEDLFIPKGGVITRTFKLFWETVVEIKTHTKILLALVLLIFVELNVGILSVVLLEYVRRYLALPLTSITYYLIFPLIVGLIVGSVLLDRIRKKFGTRSSIFYSCVVIGLLLLGLGVVPNIFASPSQVHFVRFFSILSSVVTGICIVFIAVQARTILQVTTPITMQGRVFSFLDVMVALVTPIPVLSLGFVASRLSLLTTFIGFGAIVMLVAITMNKFYTTNRNARIS